MTQTVIATAGMLFALVAGTAAFVLSSLTYRVFAGSPFGRMIAVLPVSFALFVLYHALLLIPGGSRFVAELVETASFVGLLAFALGMLRLHRRMSRRAGGGR